MGPSASTSCLTSPTCKARFARRLSSSRIWRSVASICSRNGASLLCNTLAMALFEILHKVDHGLYAGQGHGVIDGSPHAAHAFVPLELQQARLLGLGQEGAVERLVGQDERHVHARTHRPMHGIGIKSALFQVAVQGVGL